MGFNSGFKGLKAVEADKTTCPGGSTVPKGVECHFHQAFCGTVLGHRTFWGYVAMKLPTNLQERELPTSLLELNRPQGLSKQNIRNKGNERPAVLCRQTFKRIRRTDITKNIMSCRIISRTHLKWILHKLDRRLWTGFIWLKKGTSGRPLWTWS